MSIQKRSVSLTDTAYAFAKELVEAGEYPNTRAAVSGELARSKGERDRAAWIETAKEGIADESRHLEQNGPSLAGFRQL